MGNHQELDGPDISETLLTFRTSGASHRCGQKAIVIELAFSESQNVFCCNQRDGTQRAELLRTEIELLLPLLLLQNRLVSSDRLACVHVFAFIWVCIYKPAVRWWLREQLLPLPLVHMTVGGVFKSSCFSSRSVRLDNAAESKVLLCKSPNWVSLFWEKVSNEGREQDKDNDGFEEMESKMLILRPAETFYLGFSLLYSSEIVSVFPLRLYNKSWENLSGVESWEEMNLSTLKFSS